MTLHTLTRGGAKRCASRLAMLTTALLAAACQWIDDDLSTCGQDFKVSYTVRLTTNLQTELRTQLTTNMEMVLAGRLQQELADYFSERAHDISLAFFDNSNRLAHQENHVIDANEASYTIYLDAQDYRHVSVANTTGAPNVTLLDDQSLSGYVLQQPATTDTVDSHTSGHFTARAAIAISDTTQNQQFNVTLYMANSAAALVLDPGDQQFPQVRGCITGLASAFSVVDSTYMFTHTAPLRMQPLADTGSELLCLYGKGFPSRAEGATSARQNHSLRAPVLPVSNPHSAPTRAASEDDALWQMHIYVTCADGTITETRLYMPTALGAGQLMVVKGAIMPDGRVVPSQQEVGASVTLDWKEGGSYTPNL